MSNDFENPFVDYGGIVCGDRFIGRKNDLRAVENRVIIPPKNPGNLAIIGAPKIGKSSLIYRSIIDRKAELITKKFIPIWINVGIYSLASDFFLSLVTSCLNTMSELNFLDEDILCSGQDILNDKYSQTEKYQHIQSFFKKIKKAGYNVIFILDEFDYARKLFKGEISDFQRLRELYYQPDWRVTFITTSRRDLHDIEMQTPASSTFEAIFEKHYLSMFNDEDIEEYFKRLTSVKLSLIPEDKAKISFYCGGHPYLLELLGYEIVEIFREEQIVDVNKAADHIEQSLIDYYNRIVELLHEDKSFDKLLQILFGPVIDAKKIDADKLKNYGVIKLNSQGNYVGFSEHFHMFLNLLQREVDLWPIWSKTEKMIRYAIETTMLGKYGINWISEIEKSRPTLGGIFDKCRKAQQKEVKSFGSRASPNLIDYTYPWDLFAIIFAEWSIFNPIFGKDKNYWQQREILLAKIRNPLAHNRESFLFDYERDIAEGYCKEIQSILEKAHLYKGSHLASLS